MAISFPIAINIAAESSEVAPRMRAKESSSDDGLYDQ